MEITATKATFQKYSAYKESGEYWMGEIPEHWEIKKLKHVFKEKKKVTNPSLNCGSISFGKVIYKDDEKVPESTKASYQEVLAGEYLVNPLNLNYDLISLRIGLSDINVVVSSGYIVLKNAIELDKSYFNYLLHRYDVAYMKLLGSGVRQTISFNHIANSLLAYPPIEEQTAIANFLDDKTAKIDRAIAQKEQLIALLKERKQIIIQNAVTKGLDPNVKLKDSGVEWIGEIPEGWEVKKLKHLVKITGGFAFESDDFVDDGVQIIKIANTYQNRLALERQPTFVPYSYLDSHKQWVVERGDVLMSLTGTMGKTDYGFAIMVECDEKFLLNQRVAKLSPLKEIDSNYLVLLLQSDVYLKKLYSLPSGTKQANLSNEDVTGIFVPIPPNIEMVGILTFVKNQTAKIDQAISLQQTQIEKLKEYKATLIDSAVRGKIKVNL